MLEKLKKLKLEFYIYRWVMNYAKIKYHDVANGPGVRVSIFVSGCNHHCKGCFNKETWDFNYGEPFTKKEIDLIIEALKPNYISGLSVIGGEPFELVNQEGLLPLLKKVREVYQDTKSIWAYSGFTYEELLKMKNPNTLEILNIIDVLVDGKFVESLKDPLLYFRGSSNQRIIDMKKTRKNKKVILHEKNKRRC